MNPNGTTITETSFRFLKIFRFCCHNRLVFIVKCAQTHRIPLFLQNVAAHPQLSWLIVVQVCLQKPQLTMTETTAPQTHLLPEERMEMRPLAPSVCQAVPSYPRTASTTPYVPVWAQSLQPEMYKCYNNFFNDWNCLNCSRERFRIVLLKWELKQQYNL